MKYLILLGALAACGSPKGSDAVGPSSSCESWKATDYTSVHQLGHDYKLNINGCIVKLTRQDNNCTRTALIETTYIGGTEYGIKLTVYDKQNCTDGYSDNQGCSFYTHQDGSIFLNCANLGVEADFTKDGV